MVDDENIIIKKMEGKFFLSAEFNRIVVAIFISHTLFNSCRIVVDVFIRQLTVISHLCTMVLEKGRIGIG